MTEGFWAYHLRVKPPEKAAVPCSLNDPLWVVIPPGESLVISCRRCGSHIIHSSGPTWGLTAGIDPVIV